MHEAIVVKPGQPDEATRVVGPQAPHQGLALAQDRGVGDLDTPWRAGGAGRVLEIGQVGCAGMRAFGVDPRGIGSRGVRQQLGQREPEYALGLGPRCLQVFVTGERQAHTRIAGNAQQARLVATPGDRCLGCRRGNRNQVGQQAAPEKKDGIWLVVEGQQHPVSRVGQCRQAIGNGFSRFSERTVGQYQGGLEVTIQKNVGVFIVVQLRSQAEQPAQTGGGQQRSV